MRKHNDLLARAMQEEKGAIAELIHLQRQGKLLRLYPEGRKGAMDEGMAPLLVTTAPSGLVRFSFGREPIFKMQPPLVGQIILNVMRKTARVVHRYRGSSIGSLAEIESHATPGLNFTSVISPGWDAITCMFEPLEKRDFDLGVHHATQLVDQWITLILANEPIDDSSEGETEIVIDPKWGLTEEHLCDVLDFVPPGEGGDQCAT